MYTLVQLAVWWLFHTTTLFWKIRFPFHARSFEASHKIKYIHIGCVIAGVVLPLVPILTSMADFAVDLESNPSRNVSSFISGGLGYGQTRFPPILCTGSDRNAVYYSVVLPIDMILAVGCSLLVIIFWIVHKVSLTLLPLPVPTLPFSSSSLIPPPHCVAPECLGWLCRITPIPSGS